MNPLIRKKGICDPHIHIYENKVYLYATHDQPGYDNSFCMEDWHIYSSEDLIEWKQERIIRPDEFYCGSLNQCWAVDAARRNDKYYWYFSTGSWGVGVGVGDSPSGPFNDVLGKPLVDYQTAPYDVPKWDPCVFMDDDGEAYLIVGSCKGTEPWDCYLIARLNDDMISLAEPLRRIEYLGNPCREDKPSIHKYGGRYYLSHSSYYAIADCVYGPYRYVGNSGCNIDHGSFFMFHNQTYFATGGMDNPNQFFRASFIAPCHYRMNGEIVVDQKIMEYGCGQYDAAWDRIEAEWYFAASRECKIELENRQFAVNLKENDFLCFPNISNIERNIILKICAYAPKGRANIEIREDSVTGPVVGICEISEMKNEDKFETFECRLKCTSGKRTLVFISDGEVILDWFSFDINRRRSTIEPSYAEFNWGAMLEKDKDASLNRVLHNMELKGTFISGIADGGKGGKGEVVIPYYCTGDEVKLNLYINNEFQKVIFFPVTGKKRLGKVPNYKREEVVVKPGINKISLISEYGFQQGTLAIDHITLETIRSHYKTYAAANGVIEPSGNGCWDGLPQRECDIKAFSGRIVKYLGKPGYALSIIHVDGGEGGIHGLEIRYCRDEVGDSVYDLEVNNKVQQQLYFRNTGGSTLDSAEILKTEIYLEAGVCNEICIRKTGREDKGIFVDAVSVVAEKELLDKEEV